MSYEPSRPPNRTAVDSVRGFARFVAFFHEDRVLPAAAFAFSGKS